MNRPEKRAFRFVFPAKLTRFCAENDHPNALWGTQKHLSHWERVFLGFSPHCYPTPKTIEDGEQRQEMNAHGSDRRIDQSHVPELTRTLSILLLRAYIRIEVDRRHPLYRSEKLHSQASALLYLHQRR